MTEAEVDKHLTEKQALAQAKADGVEFVDTFTISDDSFDESFATREEAEKVCKNLGVDPSHIVQTRRRK